MLTLFHKGSNVPTKVSSCTVLDEYSETRVIA